MIGMGRFVVGCGRVSADHMSLLQDGRVPPAHHGTTGGGAGGGRGIALPKLAPLVVAKVNQYGESPWEWARQGHNSPHPANPGRRPGLKQYLAFRRPLI